MTQRGKFRKREQAVVALMNARTIEEAAKMAGIGTRTLKRWLTEEEFRREYDKAKSELLRTATARLRAKASGAVDTLATVARNGKMPAGARVGAAVNILRLSLDAEAQEDILRRVEALERQSDEIA